MRSPKASQRGENANKFFILLSIHLNVFMMSELEVFKNKREGKRVGDRRGTFLNSQMWVANAATIIPYG